jgi:hypothetical protein
MKDPKEVLLDQHRHAGPQLDRIRQAALASLDETKQAQAMSSTQETGHDHRPIGRRFMEWIHPFRRHVFGLGLAWAFIALLQFVNAPAPSSPQANAQASRSASSLRELLLSLREHQRQLREWTEVQESKKPAVPQTLAPPPRRATPPSIAV